MDDRGITRRLLGRETTIAWSDLDRIDETGSIQAGAQGRCVLFADDGRRRIVIPFAFLANGDQLRDQLEEHLAPLRARLLQKIAERGQIYRPGRTVGLMVLCFIAPMFLVGGLGSFEQGRSGHVEGSRMSAMVLGALSAAAATALAVLGLEWLSRVLTFSDSGIALRSLFLNRQIPFDRVESITLRFEGDSPPGEVAKIRGNDQSITMHSDTLGYRQVLAMVRSRSGVEPVRAEEIWKSAVVHLLGRMAAVGTLLMCLGFGLMLIGAWQLFSDRTATADRPASIKIGIGAALLLASVGLAIVSHQVRSRGKAEADEKWGGPGYLE